MYAHMLPDMSNNLKGYKENNNDPMEIAVPWSMFVQKREGETNAQAKARAEELLKTNPELFQTVVVRVPASGAVSEFAGQVKYFIDGQSNTGIVPKEFVEKSDADHDGDKIFIYRAELNEDSQIVDGNKTNAFNQVYEKANSTAVKNASNEGSLDLELIKDLLVKLDMYNEDIFKLENNKDKKIFSRVIRTTIYGVQENLKKLECLIRNTPCAGPKPC